MTSPSRQRTLAQLVLDLKGDRSYERLARDCGGLPTAGRLQQIATKPTRAFPDAPTLRGLARGLGVSVTEVVLATAASLGLEVRGAADPADVLLSDVGSLPPEARSAVLSVAREMVRLHEAAAGGSEGATVRQLPRPAPRKTTTNRAARKVSEPMRRDQVQHTED